LSKVDIIIPTYNPGVKIVEAIKSCLNQSYPNYKITIVDDCSKEDLSYLLKQYPNISLLRTPKNVGPAGARNYGIERTNEKYISFLDDDDIMHQDKLHHSVTELEKDKSIGMVCGNYQIIVNGKVRSPFYNRGIQINWDSLMKQNFVASGSVTVRRDVINDIGNFNEKYWIAEDYDLWLRISEKYPIKYIHKVLYYYHIVPNGNSLTQRSEIQKNHIDNLNKIKNESIKRVKSENI
jgi:glycosyltransferase involved in cell wall biosynthesis